MPYYNRTELSEAIDPAKSKIRNEWMNVQYCFFNYGFELQNLFAMVVMFWDCCILILVKLLLSLLKMLIILVILLNSSRFSGIHLLKNSLLENYQYI